MSRHAKSHNRLKTLSTFKLGFGRYGGVVLASVPRDYLNWILSSEFRGDAAAQWIVRQYIALVGKGISTRPQRPSSKAENSPKACSFAANRNGVLESQGRPIVDSRVVSERSLLAPWDDEIETRGVGEGTPQQRTGACG